MSDKSLRFLLFGQDVTAGKTMGEVAGKGEAGAKRIGSAFGKVGSTIGGEFGDVLDRIGVGIENASGGGKAAKLMATGTAIGGLGAALQLASSGDQQAADQLGQAIKNTGQSASSYKEDIEKTIKTQENFAHSAQDTQTALRILTQSTNDPKKALAEMGLVANLAAAKHISLADASLLVAKILAGKGGKSLAEFGIALKKNKNGTVDSAGALDLLGKKLNGQAAASMDNFGAKVNIVKTKLGDMVAQVGGKLGPALTAIGPVLAIAGTAMQLMAGRQAAAAVASEAATVATTEQAAATEAATVAEDGLNVSLLANPIGLIVLAVLALVAVFVVAYNKVGWFKAGVEAAFKGIKVAIGWIATAVGAVISFVKGHWSTILAVLTLPITTGVGVIKKVWGGVTAIFSAVKSAIGTVFSDLGTILIAPFKWAFNMVATIWDNTIGKIGFSLPGWLGGGSFHMPQIPHMADGGLSAGGLTLVGERGPEIVGLPRGSRVWPNGAGPGGGRGGSVVNVYVTQPLGTAEQIARAVGSALDTAIGNGSYRPRFAR